MYQRREYPEKSWSFSRHKSFLECKRSFYFNTYGHWNGWEYSANERSKQIYRLKKLSNIYALSGQLLHDEIAKAINEGEVNTEQALSRIREGLNKAVKESLNKTEQWKRSPKNHTILHEYYYGDGVSKEKGQEITQRMKTSLTNFASSYTWKLLQQRDLKILEVEKEKFPHFMLRDYKIYCILDLFYEKDEKYYIVDWKSGKIRPEENKRQMEVYALYVLNKYPGVDVSLIKGYNEYIGANERACFDFTLEDLVALKQNIVSSMQQMDEHLLDIKKNMPKDESKYPQETGGHCHFCNFIEVCDKGKEYLSH